MATCPFMKQECVTKDCALWLKNSIVTIGRGDEEKKVSFESMCSIVASGASALRGLALLK